MIINIVNGQSQPEAYLCLKSLDRCYIVTLKKRMIKMYKF